MNLQSLQQMGYCIDSYSNEVNLQPVELRHMIIKLRLKTYGTNITNNKNNRKFMYSIYKVTVGQRRIRGFNKFQIY